MPGMKETTGDFIGVDCSCGLVCFVSGGEVLFDELRLDEKCSKKLLKTQVQQQKSTSEAVVGSEAEGM